FYPLGYIVQHIILPEEAPAHIVSQVLPLRPHFGVAILYRQIRRGGRVEVAFEHHVADGIVWAAQTNSRGFNPIQHAGVRPDLRWHIDVIWVDKGEIHHRIISGVFGTDSSHRSNHRSRERISHFYSEDAGLLHSSLVDGMISHPDFA